MPIRVLHPGAPTERMVRDHLASMAREEGFRSPALGAAPPAALMLALPHPVFNLTLDQAALPGATERAAMTAWRWLLTDGRRVLAGAEAAASGPAGRAVFSGTHEGAFVQSAAAALREAESWPDVKAGRFALGLLRVPALYVMALWLRDEDHHDGGDLFVPLAPAPAPLIAGQRTPARAFEIALQALASARGRGEGASN